MKFKVPVLKGTLTLLGFLFLFSSQAQDPGKKKPEGYYYSNAKVVRNRGLVLEVSPFSMWLDPFKGSYAPSFIDATLGYRNVFIPENPESKFVTELQFFGGYASYSATEDTMIYPVYKDEKMNDYGYLALGKMTMFKGGVQVMFWRNNLKTMQWGFGLGVSGGNYSFDFDAQAGDGGFHGSISQNFITISPCVALSFMISQRTRLYFSLPYNYMNEFKAKNSTLKTINPDFGKNSALITPRIGLSINFSQLP